MRRERDRGDVELLAAYVDGVSELTLDERRRVDDLLSRDPTLRTDEAATRALIDQLRELAPAPGEPDWGALERSITLAVGTAVPQPWWQRLRWRWIVPAVVVGSAAVLAVAAILPTHAPRAVEPIAVAVAPLEPAELDLASLPLWLDGTDLEVTIEAAALFELDDDLDDDAVPETAELLPPAPLEWVDELDGESLEQVDQLLDRHPHRGRS